MGAGREAPGGEDSGEVITTLSQLSPGEHAEVLKSARKVIAQDGVEKFTLSAVAREADLPRNVLYAKFHNKNELLLALAADDLAATGRAMGGDKSKQPEPLPHGELVAALIDKTDHPDRPKLPADTIVPPPEAGPTSFAALAPEPEPGFVSQANFAAQPNDSVTQMPSVAKKRGEADQLHEIINKLTNLPTTPLGEGSAAAVARADRRLGVIEKALADLEERFDKLDKLANDGFQTTEASLGNLVQRAERTDQRISETATTLRGELLAAFTRIDPPKTEPPKVTPPPDEREFEISVSEISPSELGGETKPVETGAKPQGDLRTQLKNQTANDDYLSQARRSASDAATAAQAAAASQVRKRHRRRNHLLSRNQLLGIGAISIAVILATMGIALSEGFLDVKSGHVGAPPLRVVHPAVQPQRVASVAPRPAAPVPAPIAASAMPAPVAAPPSVKLTPMQQIEALANGGNAKAELIAGIRYLDGDGVARSEQDAAGWLERAAKAGEPVAQYRLGTLYQRGAGVVQDEAQALHWYESAANQGNRKAMHNLGVFYAEGRGTPQDYEKAASWFLRAANMGYVDSQFDLAVLYERGAGVQQSLSDAYKWYAIAARGGDDVSRARIEVLETQLDPKELTTARNAAHAFRAAPISRAANMTPVLADLRVK